MIHFWNILTGKSKSLEKIDVSAVVNDVLTDLSNLIKDQKAVIYTSKFPVINGFKRELHQLFQNLINNAIKFKKPDTPPVIEIAVSEYEGYFEFSVKDNGIGIEQENFIRIFEDFVKLENNNVKGYGIGLSNCKKIVTMHGGKIWLDSLPGKGTTFFFTIPKDLKEE